MKSFVSIYSIEKNQKGGAMDSPQLGQINRRQTKSLKEVRIKKSTTCTKGDRKVILKITA